MLVLAIILLILGAVVAYFGRPREQLIFWAGVIIFAVGVLLIILWALDVGGADTTTNALVLLR